MTRSSMDGIARAEAGHKHAISDAFRYITTFNFEGCQREILKRYRKILKALTLPNFMAYTTVSLVWMCGGYPQSSSGLEKSVSLKKRENYEVFKGCHSNGDT